MITVTVSVQRLFVVWQDPADRRFHPVALLDRVEGRYRLRYLKHAEALDRFQPFVGFPSLHERYETDQLWPFLQNRLMSPRRPDYPQFLDDLGLPADAEPFEILSRGGSRHTDSIELFAEPEVDRSLGRLRTWFFVRGSRHVSEADGGEPALLRLAAGDVLTLRHERDNVVTDQAVQVIGPDGAVLGWVPDYLVSMVHRLRALGSEVAVAAEKVNPPTTPLRTRVLCRLEAPCPIDFVPLDDPQFLPIVNGD